MKKFDGILICTDLDGTILDNDKNISAENLEAIEYFKSEGGLFTFVTGRMPFYVKDIYSILNPNCPFGCINGGGLYDHKKQEYLWNQGFDKSPLDLVEYIDEQLPGMGIQLNTFDKVYFCRENSAMEEFRRITGVENVTCGIRDLDLPLAKIVFGHEDPKVVDRVGELLDAHPETDDFDLVRSDIALHEILPKGINKGMVIHKLAELLGIDVKRTVAIGDYNNDIPMIKAAGVGVAVSNAIPEVLEAADYVTVSNQEHAIKRLIMDIDEGVLKV